MLFCKLQAFGINIALWTFNGPVHMHHNEVLHEHIFCFLASSG